MPDTVGSSSQTSDSATTQAQEKAKQVAGQAQEKAQDAHQEARKRLREQVDQRSTQAGDQIRGTAEDVRSVAMELRSQGKDTPARYAEQAADRVERAGDWLRDSDGDRILRDVEDFARRNPWAVVAGGLALGFAASRLLKASSGERYRSSVGNGSGTLPSRSSGREYTRIVPAETGMSGQPVPGTGTPRFSREQPVPPPGAEATRP
jgi:ElaB/YqjD/DUF883 family membrane-anchored ribosome-binding protein